MISNQTGHGAIYVDLECGAQFGIEFDCTLDYCSASGDGWNEPREPAHWEPEGFEPTALLIQHPDGDETALQAPQGSLLHLFLEGLLALQDYRQLYNSVEEYEL